MAQTVRAGYRSGWSGSWGRAANGARGAPTFSNGKETVRGRQGIFTAAHDPMQKFCARLGPVYIHRVQRTTATMLIIAAKQVSVFS